jgi:hypothetical protein
VVLLGLYDTSFLLNLTVYLVALLLSNTDSKKLLAEVYGHLHMARRVFQYLQVTMYFITYYLLIS